VARVACGGEATSGLLLWVSWYVEVAGLSGAPRASPYELIRDFPALELPDTLISVVQRADLGEPDARLHPNPWRLMFTPIWHEARLHGASSGVIGVLLPQGCQGTPQRRRLQVWL
jgi:hypothetical protein